MLFDNLMDILKKYNNIPMIKEENPLYYIIILLVIILYSKNFKLIKY